MFIGPIEMLVIVVLFASAYLIIRAWWSKWKSLDPSRPRQPLYRWGWKGYFGVVAASASIAANAYIDEDVSAFPVEYIVIGSILGALTFLIRWPCPLAEFSAGWGAAAAIVSFGLLRFGNFGLLTMAALSLLHGAIAGLFFRDFDQRAEAQQIPEGRD